ncbi:MAG TPA: hypothetical protein VJ418_33710 [Streptosporangiaceae bacterium]|nr:hypothetical protein [Streptosporangiaceae bacterium]
MSGLERLMDGIDQVTLHHFKVNRPAQPHGERSYDRLCVVAGAVEPAVHCALDSLAQRIEQRRGAQGRDRYRHRGVAWQHMGSQQYQPGEHPCEHGSDQRIRDHPADDAVDRVQLVLQYRDADAHRQSRRAEWADEVVCHLSRNEEGEHEHDRTAIEPLKLLPALTARAPVSGYLYDQPGEPAHEKPQDQHPRENGQRICAWACEVAADVDSDVMPSDGHNALSRGCQPEHYPRRDKDHGHAPPATGRQLPIRKHPQQDRDQDQKDRPRRHERHCYPSKGQRPVMHPVVEDGVIADGRGSK